VTNYIWINTVISSFSRDYSVCMLHRDADSTTWLYLTTPGSFNLLRLFWDIFWQTDWREVQVTSWRPTLACLRRWLPRDAMHIRPSVSPYVCLSRLCIPERFDYRCEKTGLCTFRPPGRAWCLSVRLSVGPYVCLSRLCILERFDYRCEKILKIQYSFWQNSRTWRTDTQTHRSRLHSIVRQ